MAGVIPPPDAPLSARLNDKLYRLIILLGGGFLIINSFGPLMDNVDLGWLVAHGRWIVQHGSFYRRDVMNYPNLGRSLVDEYPLFEIVIFSLWKWGWWALSAFTAALYTLVLVVLARAGRTFFAAGQATFTLSLGAMMLYIASASTLRPHLVSYVCLALLGVFLLRHRDLPRWQEAWPLIPLQIVWTNCHSAFVLGPLMVGLFGFELVVRASFRQRALAIKVLRVWGIVFLLVLFSCLINPSGLARFYPPFYQGSLESIRAYVSEMQPRPGLLGSLYAVVGAISGLAILVTLLRRGGAVSFSFALLAVVFYFESLSVQKSWPIFGIFLPLTLLSAGAFRPANFPLRLARWPSLAGNLVLSVFLAVAFSFRTGAAGDSAASLFTDWRDYQLGRRELPYPAVAWMRQNGVEGRLFHRCEDGGLLQLEGYDRGQTFADTGFGKYDEKQIHLVAMIGERPGLLPLYLTAYRPSFVLCNNFGFRWPFQLRLAGLRLIFYSPYGTVWATPGLRTDLPTVSDQEIDATFARDLPEHGRAYDTAVVGRSILSLHSLGRGEDAFAQLRSLPPQMHRLGFYWEAASIMCFEDPALSPALRQKLTEEANELHTDTVTAEFRARVLAQAGDEAGARTILESVPRSGLTAQGADLLLKIDVEQNRPEAVALAHQSALFDLRDGRRWQYTAQAEERAGNIVAAAKAWSQAVFYYPDDAQIMEGARKFLTLHPSRTLEKTIAASGNVRGN